MTVLILRSGRSVKERSYLKTWEEGKEGSSEYVSPFSHLEESCRETNQLLHFHTREEERVRRDDCTLTPGRSGEE